MALGVSIFPKVLAMAFKLMREEVDGFLEALSDENLASFFLLVPPLTLLSLPRIPLPGFLSYVCASGGFSC